MLRTYDYKFGDPFTFKAGPYLGKMFSIVRNSGSPSLEPIDYPRETLVGSTASLTSDDSGLDTYINTRYLKVDPFTKRVVNTWIAEQLLKRKIQRIPLAGFCGSSAMSVEEVLDPMSELTPEEVPLVIKVVAKILDKAQEWGLSLGDGTFGLLIDTEHIEVKLKLKNSGISYPSGQGWIRLVSEDWPLRQPSARKFMLTDVSGESCWFQVELPHGAQISELGLPPVQGALNFYKFLSQISKIDVFQQALTQNADFAAKIQDLTRGNSPQGILKKPMRCDVLTRVMSW